MRGRGVKLLIHSPEEIRDRTRGFSVGSIVTAVDAALLCRYVGFLAQWGAARKWGTCAGKG